MQSTNPNHHESALVLLSGGVDSSTTLALAARDYASVYALSFDYGQRNVHELTAARAIAKIFDVVEHRVVRLDIAGWGGSSLTDHDLPITNASKDEIPSTYVPARNTIFLSNAIAFAEVKKMNDIFIGANIVDYSNYPDCRPEFLTAFETMANLATREGIEGNAFKIHAPLLKLSKAEILSLGDSLNVDYAKTLSCYNPSYDGKACGQCDSCRWRAKGFSEAGLADVTEYAD